MTIATETSKSPAAFQLKGSLFTLTVLQLIQSELEAFQSQLQETLAKAPKFFKYAPIILDLNDYEVSAALDLDAIVKVMRAQDLIPVGIRGGDQSAQQQANAIGLAVMMNSTSSQFIESKNQQALNKSTDIEPDKTKLNTKNDQNTTPNVAEVANSTKVITQPVRSGQQIYAKGGDLIVLASVSHGAEILADGHIHVYGPLRGRALAGIMGNEEAKIFCSSLEAELVSIAGRYLVNEQLGDYKDKMGLHIYLENDQLSIRTI